MVLRLYSQKQIKTTSIKIKIKNFAKETKTCKHNICVYKKNIYKQENS